MNNHTFIIASVILCSLGGWYVVVNKYLALKQMFDEYNNESPDYELPPHIPGMGPPPVSNIPFTMPKDYIDDPYYDPPPLPGQEPAVAQRSATAMPATSPNQKREICNFACMQHLTGFAVISGVPFLNVVVPAMFWLWKKEQHPFIDKQGREVINFQITFTLIQFMILGAGALFIRYMPAQAAKLFAFTKIAGIVFSSGMYLPFNVFTMLPFFWCVIVMIRGSVAAYNGINYKYPAAQQFLFVREAAAKKINPKIRPRAQTQAEADTVMTGRVSFS